MILRLSNQAKTNLGSIKSYIEKDSRYYAAVTLQKIIERIEILLKYPEIGRIILKNDKATLRQILIYKYRIIYRIVGEVIEILTIHHSAKLLNDNPGISQYFDVQ